MAALKLQAPLGCVAVSFRGASIPIDRDGAVDVDDAAAAILLAHGFLKVSASCSVEAARGDELIDIASLNRGGLFAFLRSKGIAVRLPITNEELRAAARRAVAISGHSTDLL